jgi:hypothetical protein
MSLKALAKLEPELKVPDYTTIRNRLESLKLDLKSSLSLNGSIVIALYSSGISTFFLSMKKLGKAIS